MFCMASGGQVKIQGEMSSGDNSMNPLHLKLVHNLGHIRPTFLRHEVYFDIIKLTLQMQFGILF